MTLFAFVVVGMLGRLRFVVAFSQHLGHIFGVVCCVVVVVAAYLSIQWKSFVVMLVRVVASTFVVVCVRACVLAMPIRRLWHVTATM